MTDTAIVIDDDRDIVYVLSEIIETLGIKVIGKGYNGVEAFELFKKHEPTTIFLDIMMPEFDGFYAIENILKIVPKAKIIAITADIAKETREKLLKLNIPMIYKPFEINEIAKIIKN